MSSAAAGDRPPPSPGRARWRDTVYTVIFEADTPAGRWFDILLIASILASVIVVMLGSIRSVSEGYGGSLHVLEWFFTLIFSVEYALRLLSSPSAARYARSFYGVVDLLSVLPTYLVLLFPSGRYFLVLRVLRILRIFRVLKLAQYVRESETLMRALWSSRRKIAVFMFSVLTLVIVFGSLMYVIEGEANGFTSIPRSVYWAIVTLTTVGYGDISPATGAGQMVAAIIMLLGYAIIAVPTGIVTAEMVREGSSTLPRCASCGAGGHQDDARHCRRCGTPLKLAGQGGEGP